MRSPSSPSFAPGVHNPAPCVASHESGPNFHSELDCLGRGGGRLARGCVDPRKFTESSPKVHRKFTESSPQVRTLNGRERQGLRAWPCGPSGPRAPAVRIHKSRDSSLMYSNSCHSPGVGYSGPPLSRTHLRIPIPLRAAEQQLRAAVQLPSRLLKEPCSSRIGCSLVTCAMLQLLYSLVSMYVPRLCVFVV